MHTGRASEGKESSGVDPGWKPALKRSWLILIPLANVIAFHRMGSRSKTNGLTNLRAVWLGMLGGMMVVVLVTLAVVGGEDPRPLSFFPAMVIGDGLFVLGFIVLTRRRPLAEVGRTDLNDPAAIALAYRSKMFVGTALSEAPLLLGFVGVFVVERPTLIFLGVPFAILGFVLSAPSVGDIQRRQEELINAGSHVNLVHALVGYPPT